MRCGGSERGIIAGVVVGEVAFARLEKAQDNRNIEISSLRSTPALMSHELCDFMCGPNVLVVV